MINFFDFRSHAKEKQTASVGVSCSPLKLFKLFKSIFPRFTLKYSFVDLKYLNCKKK